jgi:hypothetical protein
MEVLMINQDHMYASTLYKRWELYSATPKDVILEEFRRRWWELYSATKNEAILEEFRRRFPDDHFGIVQCRRTFDREASADIATESSPGVPLTDRA